MNDDERNFIILNKHLLGGNTFFFSKEIKGVEELKKYLNTRSSLVISKIIEGNFIETELKVNIIENKEEVTKDIK